VGWTWPAWFLLGFSNGLDLGVALGSADELELDFNLTYLFLIGTCWDWESCLYSRMDWVDTWIVGLIRTGIGAWVVAWLTRWVGTWDWNLDGWTDLDIDRNLGCDSVY